MHISSSEDEEEACQSSLVIERIPEKHRKDLTQREVNQVRELHVFVVPSKEEIVDGEKVMHKPILREHV